MIPYTNRFHGHSSLNFVYKKGQAVRSNRLIIKFSKNPIRKQSRIAVVISKKVLKGAVKRNRVRRQIYSYAYDLLSKLNSNYDIAFIVISGELFKASHNEIFQEIDQLINQLNIKQI